MKFGWIVLSIAAFAIAATPAGAKVHKRKQPVAAVRCIGNPPPPSLGEWLFGVRPHPEWNGCSPPVYVGGEFIGQDPDPNVRIMLRRDPSQGYTVNFAGGGRK